MTDEECDRLVAEDLLDDDFNFDHAKGAERVDCWCACFLLAVAVGLFLVVHFVGVP